MTELRPSKELLDEMRAKRSQSGFQPRLSQLLFAVVQAQDVPRAVRSLEKVGLFIIKLPSTGGFLGRRSTTVMVGLADDQVELAASLIRENCKQRVEYVSTPLEGAPMPIPVATPVTVGGATLFTFPVERFEEF